MHHFSDLNELLYMAEQALKDDVPGEFMDPIEIATNDDQQCEAHAYVFAKWPARCAEKIAQFDFAVTFLHIAQWVLFMAKNQ
ncbi:hypothetical protein AMAG_19073 [Allomyces macrogynus ATCC 38327]|uniref:Uncharacterized protein n=1 Tax=Allomyces macrogynus (strain ATCC 38327) TaxID=578462 RepID=A0A0L0SMR1_ALLM3|nr:hypothetical protein AMAG_19073 [Allomyces macrogynus ATCC 38327]|eukprot:KNE63841.1 hypothetical protein AMAG_19073 [Allomyces macrogynus ATCC 38327]